MLRMIQLLTVLLLTVSPQQSFAPTTLTIKLQVEPNETNRLVRVILDNGDYFRSTDIDLEGAAAKKTLPPLTYPRVPAGDYQLIAQLFDRYGHIIATARQTVVVIGME